MAIFLLLGMILIPIIEIAVLIEAGGQIGVWPTIGAVILTAFIGTILLRQQGLATYHKVQKSVEQNQSPMEGVFNGMCLLIAGALLLTPGFVTDAVGFLLFIPIFRTILGKFFWNRLTASGHVHMHPGGHMHTNESYAPDHGTTIIEGEFQNVSPTDSSSDETTPTSTPQLK